MNARDELRCHTWYFKRLSPAGHISRGFPATSSSPSLRESVLQRNFRELEFSTPSEAFSDRGLGGPRVHARCVCISVQGAPRSARGEQSGTRGVPLWHTELQPLVRNCVRTQSTAQASCGTATMLNARKSDGDRCSAGGRWGHARTAYIAIHTRARCHAVECRSRAPTVVCSLRRLGSHAADASTICKFLRRCLSTCKADTWRL